MNRKSTQKTGKAYFQFEKNKAKNKLTDTVQMVTNAKLLN